LDSVDIRAQQLRSVFDAREPLTIGLEEEVMLLDPETLDLSPSAAEALELLEGDARFKPELPASQLEILTEPEHQAMIASAKSAGMVQEGVLRAYLLEHGKRVDVAILSLLPGDMERA